MIDSVCYQQCCFLISHACCKCVDNPRGFARSSIRFCRVKASFWGCSFDIQARFELRCGFSKRSPSYYSAGNLQDSDWRWSYFDYKRYYLRNWSYFNEWRLGTSSWGCRPRIQEDCLSMSEMLDAFGYQAGALTFVAAFPGAWNRISSPCWRYFAACLLSIFNKMVNFIINTLLFW
jgi:hypothetical protein